MRLIKNFDQLASTREREAVLKVLEAGIERVDPFKAVKAAIQLRGNVLIVKDQRFDLSKYRRIIVVGLGKASGRMAEAVERVLGDLIEDGLIIIPKGTTQMTSLRKVRVAEAIHPLPTEENLRAAEALVKLVEGLNEKTLLIILISGGGSALLTYPAEGVSLESLKTVTKALMNAGADIFELNTVRKHLSAVKGGQLARLAQPATIISLIMSDVVGDDLSVIASGPTAPDPSTFQDAKNVLERRGLWESVPPDIRERILAGVVGRVRETPKPGDPLFKRVHNFVIASVRDSLEAMVNTAGRLGYPAVILTPFLEGEAREAAKFILAVGRSIRVVGRPFKPPIMLLFGGETTVTVKGGGRGGRNQEFVLATVPRLKMLERAVVASIGTDGIDGPTDAAGAIADEGTMSVALGRGLDPIEYLENNDSYNFFYKAGGLIFTGPTGTNVGDIGAMLLP